MFESRQDAAQLLTVKLLKTVEDKDIAVLALARGAVPMGRMIADYLSCPFDTIVCKKIGAPLNIEFAIGAVAPKNTIYWNENVLKKIGLSKNTLRKLKLEKEEERKKLEKKLRSGKTSIEIKNKTIVLIDDGVATGATVMAALLSLKKQKANKIILAVPVIAKDTFKDLRKFFDKIITLKKTNNFYAVGQFYRNFKQVTDEEVIKILESNIS
ncbi:MAG: phosphoribosyltransferase [Candidatus Levybacteria bacterium CG_4_9_14_3_um_filter_35_16]|nr:MAG: phosphoribosyltransferase [Candidatus Levybacteria bacterium CG22_combo_CG10-13_8_21_14_all_35_11]PIY95136.1 MAG: phosphoribosyltransferase [Candidatus Levybacteria bacterium CG_4_10_14_0_8_um_filter_35_23]PIZ98186.1 MAG: phosphoribosyltransferase [Candidatus Levybacteria bacterium CG_4_10_14_0_2_um_filter_35_8]PJA91023.1 MAG: phosphoribosyltransferase [Candidatus Levybacteria bacterium CG_4_9_14_3_um_filter_35_16]PJC54740.1 MAG: phosphoribosyltransferase [Candidatus Levybacteria bacter